MHAITWILIVIGWLVALLIAKGIADRNNRINNIQAVKKNILDSTNDLVKTSIDYWMEQKTSLDVLILFKLDCIATEINEFVYSPEKSKSELAYRRLKRAITEDERFRTSSFEHDETINQLVENITLVSKEFYEAIKKIPPS